eukprot:gene4670-5455_t
MQHLLDNPVYNALNTGNKNISEGTGNVKFYRQDIAPFAGLKENSKENLLELYEFSQGYGDVFWLVSPVEISLPKPWTLLRCVPLRQMICEQPVFRVRTTIDVVELSDAHIPEMLSLTKLTKPGPFRERTIDFGHYQGIFDGGTLVAMAGQRMHAAAYAEVSAVCTLPGYTGRGYAAQLVLSQVRRITAAGEIPFLHVAADNERAIEIYGSLGFRVRKEMFVYLIKKQEKA